MLSFTITNYLGGFCHHLDMRQDDLLRVVKDLGKRIKMQNSYDPYLSKNILDFMSLTFFLLAIEFYFFNSVLLSCKWHKILRHLKCTLRRFHVFNFKLTVWGKISSNKDKVIPNP